VSAACPGRLVRAGADQTEAGGNSTEKAGPGRWERSFFFLRRYVRLESRPLECGVLPFFYKVGAHRADELAGAVGAGLKGVRALLVDLIAVAKLFLPSMKVVRVR